MEDERFSVYQFFPNERWEKVRDNVPAAEAVNAFRHYISCVGAQLGTTVRVIITDSGDLTCAEWIRGKGIVFPTEKDLKNAGT